MDSVVVIKVVSLFLYPVGLFFLLLSTSFVLKTVGGQKKSRFLVCISIFLLFISSLPIFSDALLGSLESVYPQRSTKQYQKHDVILVLGGGLRIPSKPSFDVQFNNATDRYWLAARLYLAGKAPNIMIAGGNVFDRQGVQSEAVYAADLLQQWGVPKHAILIEKNSRTTEQNFKNISQFIPKQASKVLLVTSASHMRRSVWHAKQAGINVTAAPADVLVRVTNRPAIFNYLPSVTALNNTTIALHEIYGLAFVKLKALISST